MNVKWGRIWIQVDMVYLLCVHKVPSGFWKIVARKQIELAICGLQQITVKLWKFFCHQQIGISGHLYVSQLVVCKIATVQERTLCVGWPCSTEHGKNSNLVWRSSCYQGCPYRGLLRLVKKFQSFTMICHKPHVASSICLRTTIFQNLEGTLWTHCTTPDLLYRLRKIMINLSQESM
jgi:hypothetical protein